MTGGFVMTMSDAEIALEIKIKKAYRAFNRRVKTDEDALDVIYKKLKKLHRIGCQCGCTDVVRKKGARSFVCSDCKEEIHFTVGTVYEGKVRIRAMLGAIHLSERNLPVTSSKLSKLFKIGYGTAHNILLNQGILINKSMPSSALALTGKGLQSIIFRRSSETPIRRHPVAEQEEVEKELFETTASTNESSKGSNKDTDSTNELELNLTDDQKRVLKALSETSQSVDDLCIITELPAGAVSSALVFLHLDNLVDELPGGRYTRKAPVKQSSMASRFAQNLEALNISLNAFIAFIELTSKGVSRKCLQLYLSQFWYHLDKTFWQKGALSLLYLNNPSPSPMAVRNYVSPNLLRLPAFSL